MLPIYSFQALEKALWKKKGKYSKQEKRGGENQWVYAFISYQMLNPKQGGCIFILRQLAQFSAETLLYSFI